MQNSKTRKYWAERRKREARQPKGFTATHTKTVLIAKDILEYQELTEQYPQMEVVLDDPAPQMMMFNNEEYLNV